ncbi:MAG: TetR/AcrR family transcriptional regulator [Acidimicrobiales bacterium]|nr:TetR/AcrR family transcriptional regulator [Acidimicrobiales bacterium]
MPKSPAESSSTKGEQSRQLILDAAVERFAADGFKATKVADIARHAGVSGTLAYAYFDNKEDLFRAALDQDAAGVINDGISSVIDDGSVSVANRAWRESLIFTLLDSLDRHPLARRVLAGLEPTAIGRMIELPALEELRATMAARLKDEQATGTVRPDVDPVAMASGAVSIYISMLMAVVQFGSAEIERYGPDILAVLAAAVDPVVPKTG